MAIVYFFISSLNDTTVGLCVAVCLTILLLYLINTWFSERTTLSFTFKKPILTHMNEVGVTSIRGRRSYNEDTYVAT
eukprot:UN04812